MKHLSRRARFGMVLALGALMLLPVRFAFADDGIEPYANTGDTPFKFDLQWSGATYQGSEPRRKDDSSSVYIFVMTKNLDRCKAYVDGATSANGPWYNQTVYGYATIRDTGKFRIMSNVHENGYTMARLTGWADSQPGWVSGLWSPDSLGSYTAINGG